MRPRTDAQRIKERDRNRRRREEAQLGHLVAGVDKRLRIAEQTKVMRRCTACAQVFDSTLRPHATCPYCEHAD